MKHLPLALAVLGISTLALAPAPEIHTVAVPKPAVELTAGNWKYKTTVVQADGTYVLTYSNTIKDDGGVWTVAATWETPDGPVTDIQTLEKSTLILRKESFKHFPKHGQPWKPVAINLDFIGDKVTGAMKYVSGQATPVTIDLAGPFFAGGVGSDVTIGCLPLADGYSTTLRTFDIQKLVLNAHASREETLVQLKVMGMERVTVPAGTFNSYKVELTSPDGDSYKETLWIAKDSHTPVKAVERDKTGSSTAELVPWHGERSSMGSILRG